MPQDMPESGRRLPRVCHITTVHPPFDGRIFHKECLSLKEAGYEVHLVACHDRDETVNGVHIHGLPSPSGRLVRLALWPWLAYRKILSIRPRPDLIHFHDPELLLMGMVLRLRGFRVVFDVHENVAGQLLHKPYLPQPLRRSLAAAYPFIERSLVSGMGTVHVMENIALRYRLPRVVVRNLPVVRFRPEEYSKSFQPPWRIIYTGGVTRDRGAIRMLELMEDLVANGVDAKLRIVGQAEPGVAEEMLCFINAHGLTERVAMTGGVPWQESLAMVRQSHLGLCLLAPTPNYTNGLPVKGYEYLSFGLACLASNFECYRPVFEHTGSGILVDPLDRKAILQAALGLLRDPGRMAQMGRNGVEEVYRSSNWQKEFKCLLGFYDEMLAEPGAHPEARR